MFEYSGKLFPYGWGVILVAGLSLFFAFDAFASLGIHLGVEEIVQVELPPVDLQVPGYSVPSYVDWNNDGLNDLVVGEGGGLVEEGRIRIYLNAGTTEEPFFDSYFYVQSNGEDLICPAVGCLSCFPRVVYWDSDDRKDLLIGQSNGYIKIYLNVGSDTEPMFDGGSYLMVGSDIKEPIIIGLRATPAVVDWDNDGRKDLVVGDIDGKFHLFINEGTHYDPNFLTETYIQENGDDLVVPTRRSSPDVLDLTGDGKKDILTGNTEGQLILYPNIGTDEQPVFSGYIYLESDHVPIDLPGILRSRPYVCDWTGDGHLDVLVGAGDGLIHLYQTVLDPGDANADYIVDMDDIDTISYNWARTDCSEQNNWCGRTDVLQDGAVGLEDILEFTYYWLLDAP